MKRAQKRTQGNPLCKLLVSSNVYRLRRQCEREGQRYNWDLATFSPPSFLNAAPVKRNKLSIDVDIYRMGETCVLSSWYCSLS